MIEFIDKPSWLFRKWIFRFKIWCVQNNNKYNVDTSRSLHKLFIHFWEEGVFKIENRKSTS